MTKNEPKTLTSVQIISAFFICSMVLMVAFGTWWKSSNTTNPEPAKYSTCDMLQEIKYIDVGLYFKPLTEHDVENYWSSRGIIKDQDRQESYFSSTIMAHSSLADFGLRMPGEKRNESHLDVASTYLTQALRKLIVAQGFQPIGSLGNEFKAKASTTSSLIAAIRIEKQHGSVLFQIRSRYRQRVQMPHQANLLTVVIAERSSPVYRVEEDSAVLAIKSVVQEQAKGIIKQVRKNSLVSDHQMLMNEAFPFSGDY